MDILADTRTLDPAEIEALPAEPAPKRRGRPPRAASPAAEASPDAAPDAAESGAKRGRKPKAASLNYGEILCGIHALLAMRLNMPALAISPEKADKLGEAINRVQRHYPIAISQKAADWSFLAYVAFETYAPVVVTIVAERKARAAENKPEKDGTISPT